MASQSNTRELANRQLGTIRKRIGAVRVDSPGRSPFLVAAVVGLAYLWWLVAAARQEPDARYFVLIGRNFLALSHASAVIKVDPTFRYYPSNGFGYDGQFSYYIAIDPLKARFYGADAYRYTRILYPMTARALALGRVDWVPYTLILINVLAAIGGTLAVAAWLSRNGVSPWFALIFGLFPGMFTAVLRDLTEPLSYALTALAVYLFDFGGSRRIVWAGLVFALAALARESALVFALVYALLLLVPATRGARGRLRENASSSALLAGLALIPFAVWKLVLWAWLGSLGVPSVGPPQPLPFQGILSYWPWPPEQLNEVFSVALPALICAGVGVWALVKRVWTAEVLALVANVALFVVFLNQSHWIEYYAVGRVTMGAVLAALLCIPVFDRLGLRSRSWLWVSAILWFLPWYSYLPQAMGRVLIP